MSWVQGFLCYFRSSALCLWHRAGWERHTLRGTWHTEHSLRTALQRERNRNQVKKKKEINTQRKQKRKAGEGWRSREISGDSWGGSPLTCKSHHEFAYPSSPSQLPSSRGMSRRNPLNPSSPRPYCPEPYISPGCPT